MKIGFIGCGNMGRAMVRGILDSGQDPRDVMASAAREATLARLEEEFHIRTARANRDVAEFADILFLAVKPQYYAQVIGEIRDAAEEGKVIVTVAPGKTHAWLLEQFGGPRRIVRTMPNTPAQVKQGMTALCPNEYVTQEELDAVQKIFEGFSGTEVVPEHLLDVVTAVSGSSPAYVFLFIEAMADAAVSEGMPRAQAYRFAAQAILGSAQMALQTGMHPGALKDMVCSPGGTTIEAVRVLEKEGFRSAVIEAVKACAKKSREMI